MTTKFYEVPKGTRPSQCRGKTCRATIYWIRTPLLDKPIPIDCDVDGGWEPTDLEPGSGVSHFTTCVDVRQFSGANRKAAP